MSKLADSSGNKPSKAKAVSCKKVDPQHDTHQPDELKQTALTKISEAIEALHQWQETLETQGILFGELHSYPHRGQTRYNFYPDATQTPVQRTQSGSIRRIYVRQNQLVDYRQKIARGSQVRSLNQLKQQLTDVMQTIDHLA